MKLVRIVHERIKGHLAKCGTRLQQVHVGLNLFKCQVVYLFLGMCRTPTPAQPRPRNVYTDAVGANQVRIEGDELPGVDKAAAALLKQGLQRGPDAISRVSIHSPPRAMFSA